MNGRTRGDSGVSGTARHVSDAAPGWDHIPTHCVGEDGGRGRHSAYGVDGVMSVGTTSGASMYRNHGSGLGGRIRGGAHGVAGMYVS